MKYSMGWLISLMIFTAVQAQPTVGVSERIDVILPGAELEVIPLTDRKTPVVLRIEEAEPTENGFRYRMVYYGLEAGNYDLRQFLRWKDRQVKEMIPDRPAWHIRIDSVLPPGQMLPHPVEPKADVEIGGYRKLLWGLGIFWGIGFLVILFWPRKKRPAEPIPEHQLTLADRLKPLVERGLQSSLTTAEQAQLERLLMAFWRKRLNLERVDPSEAIRQLKSHEEAGKLLRTLENWLHAPPALRESISVEELLQPYRSIEAEALEVAAP